MKDKLASIYSQFTSESIIIITLFLIILIFFAILCILIGRKIGQKETQKKFQVEEKEIRKDAVKRSKAVITGLVGEQLAPFFPDFPCNANDAHFIGKPIDIIAFPGSSCGNIEEVLFIEIKTGDAKLSSQEKTLKEAIQNKKIRYIEYRLPLKTN